MNEHTSEAVTLPSGMRIAIRKWTSNELVRLFELAHKARDNSMSAFYKMLMPVWTETLDPGPYDPALFPIGDAKPADAWKRMLLGDVLVAIMNARRIKLGDEFSFPIKCPACGNAKGSLPVKLSELVVKPLGAEARTTFMSKKLFATEVGGARLEFELMSPSQDEIIEKLLSDLRAKKIENRYVPSMIERFAAQIRTINGKALKPLERWDWVAHENDDIFALRDALAEPDCGVEQRVDAICSNPACENEFEVSVPLVVGTTFWMRPSTRLQSSTSSQSA